MEKYSTLNTHLKSDEMKHYQYNYTHTRNFKVCLLFAFNKPKKKL